VVVGLTGVTMKTLFPWLPAAVQDINVGIIALAVNFAVLILVSLATRLSEGASPISGRATYAALRATGSSRSTYWASKMCAKSGADRERYGEKDF
jgi:hypothetical protein